MRTLSEVRSFSAVAASAARVVVELSIKSYCTISRSDIVGVAAGALSASSSVVQCMTSAWSLLTKSITLWLGLSAECKLMHVAILDLGVFPKRQYCTTICSRVVLFLCSASHARRSRR